MTQVVRKSVEAVISALALLLLNVYICSELFRREYLWHMGSIEGAFLGLSRYILEHWNDLTWFPLWNAGIPYPTTYPPLLHLVVAAVAFLGGLSPAHAYHWTTALAYCLGPVALFALVWRLSGSRWAGFVAGLIYSSVSMSAWLVPAIARDLGSPFFPRRLQALVFYGEGPHVSSMTLLTLALLFLDIAMSRKRASYILLAAVALAATALTNWLGAFAIALIVIPYAIAYFTTKNWKREVVWLVLIGAAAYGLAMPLMPPSTIRVLIMNAQTTGGDYSAAYRFAWLAGPAALAALAAVKVGVRRWAAHLQFAILFACVMTVITLADAWGRVAIVPLAIRYHLEMEMALTILLACAAQRLINNRPQWIAVACLAALVLALVLPIRLERRFARRFLLVPIDIQGTIEWKTAQWLNQHWTGGRVMLPGSIGIWLTAFSDTPELWGFDQGTTDSMIRVAQYAIHNAPAGPQDVEASVMWLKALGVQAVAVSGPSSTEVYKDFRDPKKFEGVLEPIWRAGRDDALYRVGRADVPLARVIPRGALVSRAPIHGLDIDPLRPYVAALDDPGMPRAEFRWISMHSAEIRTNLEAGQVVSVQMAWHGGWQVIANGRLASVQRDAIGLMYIDADLTGPSRIEMVYDGGTEMSVARIISVLTMLLLLVTSARGLLKARKAFP